MASSKITASIALFLVLNLLIFITFSAACDSGCTSPPPPAASSGQCPVNILNLNVCVNLLNSLLNAVIGTSNTQCCSLINGLADLDAAVCLCTALKANVLGVGLDIPLCIKLLLNNCGKQVPTGYQCN